MNCLNLNGQWLDASAPVLGGSNRSFLYGDGLFETMRLSNGNLLFVSDHLSRLQAGTLTLGIEYPVELTLEYLKKIALEIVEKNKQPTSARLRLTLYREGNGFYTPANNKASWVLVSSPLENASYALDKDGLTIGLYEEEKKSTGVLANHKTTSALLYIMASKYRVQQKWDDALILNQHSRIIEATSSNIFLVKGSHLHTPSLSEGPVAGVFRKNLLQWAAESGFGISSGQVTKEMLNEADEVLLTNVISGFRYVARFGSKTYGNKVAGQLTDLMNKELAL